MSDLVLLACVTLAAGVLQSATGFGFAVVAVPFFLLVLDSLAAIQINIVLNLVNALVVAPRLWRLTRRDVLARLAGGATLGLPLGIALWSLADLRTVKAICALVIVAFALHLLVGRRRRTVRAPLPGTGSAPWWVGGVAGAMTACLAMPGPPVLVWMSHYALDKELLRSTTLTLYVYAYAAALALQAGVGDMSAETWELAGLLAPLAVGGAFLGHRLSPWLGHAAFMRIVLGTLLVTGLYMLWEVASSGWPIGLHLNIFKQ